MKSIATRVGGIAAAAVTLTACVGEMAPSPGLAPPPTPAAMSADQICRQYADAQIAPLRNQTNANTVGSTLLGAGLGAALGGAIGGGRGAGIGAASGAIVGTGVGAANAQNAAGDIQQQYNMYYANCMSAQGAPPGAPPPGAYPPSGGPEYPPPPGGPEYPPPPGGPEYSPPLGGPGYPPPR